MTITEAINILELHNQWRRNRDDDVVIEMQSSTEIGIAIDVLVEFAKTAINKREPLLEEAAGLDW